MFMVTLDVKPPSLEKCGRRGKRAYLIKDFATQMSFSLIKTHECIVSHLGRVRVGTKS